MILGETGLQEGALMHILGNLIIEPLDIQQSHNPRQQQHHHHPQHLNQSEQLAFRRSGDWRREGQRGGSPPAQDNFHSHHEPPKNKYQIKVDLEARRRQQKLEEGQHAQDTREEISSLKRRMEALEGLVQGSVDRAAENGEAIREMNFQLLQKVREQDQTLNERIDMLAKFNEEWRKDNHQELSQEIQQLKEELTEEGEELRRQQQDFEKEVREERYIAEERVESLIQEMMEQEKKNYQSIRAMEKYFQQLFEEEARAMETEFKKELKMLEERLFLKLKEDLSETSEVDTKDNEAKHLVEATQIFLFGKADREDSQSELRESLNERAREESRLKFTGRMPKSAAENLLDRSTPYAKNFRAESNSITLVKEEWKDDKKIYNQQVLLNTVVRQVFTFSTYVARTKRNAVVIGVVDRNKQKQEMDSFASGNAICYSGFKGRINYGEGGEWKFKDIRDTLCEGMEVRVVVDMHDSTVTFTLKYPDKVIRTHSIYSDILSHPQREFVPFFQLTHAGDTVEWII